MSAQASLFPGGWGRPVLDVEWHRFEGPHSVSLCERASIGDVWLLGCEALDEHHRLCGDCLALFAATASPAELDALYESGARPAVTGGA